MFSRQGTTLRFEPNSMDPFTGQLSRERLTVEFDFNGDGTPERFLFVK